MEGGCNLQLVIGISNYCGLLLRVLISKYRLQADFLFGYRIALILTISNMDCYSPKTIFAGGCDYEQPLHRL